MSTLVGIDLGTTNSLVAVFKNGKPLLIKNRHGSFLTPSCIGMLDSGEVVVGQPARDLKVSKPDRCAWNFKRLMGTNEKLKLGSTRFSAPELSSLILKSLKQDAEDYLGESVEEAVITVPAYFNDQQRQATKFAGELAGLKVRRILNEPTAAALVYGFNEQDEEKKLIVFDLGGGTFDVTAMEVFEGVIEIISTAGETQLGGEDFTERVVSFALEHEKMLLETAEMQYPKMVSRLFQECEHAKRRLVENDVVYIRIPDVDGEMSDDSNTIELSRRAYAKVCEPLTDRLRRPLMRAVGDSNVKICEFDQVILVGGATRSLEIRDFVKNIFKKDPCCVVNPDEAVALGAAVQAALIQDDAAVSEMVMTDICPHTLGIAVSKDLHSRIVDGYFSPIIHRNTTLPVSKEEVFSTVTNFQTAIEIEVYQGESRKVEGNHFIGKLTLNKIPRAKAGEPVVFVRFTYDLNGILEVEAFLENSKEKATAVFANSDQAMSQAEIDTALKKMQEIKFFPREDARNMHLVLFAEQVIGEVNPMLRNDLESALEAFENSLYSSNRDFFEVTRNNLIITLSGLGFVFDEDSAEENRLD